MKEFSLASARKLGIDLPIREVKSEIIPGNDRLEVYEQGDHLFTANNICLSLLYESSTSLSALWIKKIPVYSQEVIPIDSEGMMKGDRFIHFNREAYLIPVSEISGKNFGEPLQKFEVYQLDKTDNGIPVVKIPDYKDFLGPEKVKVNNPHLWAPEDMMVSCLRNLNIECYKGKEGIELELEKTKAKKAGRSLVSKEYLTA